MTTFIVTPEIAQDRGLPAEDIGGEMTVGEAVPIWQLIGVEPESQAAVDATVAAIAAGVVNGPTTSA